MATNRLKFAYLILCHKNAPQVQRLVDRLNEPDAAFVLHISKTCDRGFDTAIKSVLAAYPNVYFCKREDGTHNGFGVVKGILNGLDVLFRQGIAFDYVHLLSGQDYPVKSREEIKSFFEANKGKQFLEYFPIYAHQPEGTVPNHPWGAHRQLFRVNRYHLKIDGAIRSIPEVLTGRLIDKTLYRTVKIFLYESPAYLRKKTWMRELQLLVLSRILPKRRTIPKDFELYGGKTWWSFTQDAAAYILQTVKTDRRFIRFFRYTLIPDEMFFQTILLNSDFKTRCENNSLRFIIWTEQDGLHPIFLTEEYVLQALAKPACFFARKFDTEQNGALLDKIDEAKFRG